MRRIGRYKITLSVALLALLTQLPRLFPKMSGWPVVASLVLVVAVAAYIEHMRSAPALRLQDKRKALLDYACKNPMVRLRTFDSTARLNIMLIDGLYFRSLSRFSIIYDLHVADKDPDKRMRMRIGQGVCGDAADKGLFSHGDISDKKGPAFGLDPEQLEKTKNVRLVMSMPIMKAVNDETGEPRLTEEVIGVVNIDSKRRDALHFYRTRMVGGKSLLDRQEQALEEISRFCSYLELAPIGWLLFAPGVSRSD
ncbi:MAG: hypothetical protein M3R38_02980 [Actinomycetota bacterium]|nr:hypothetical protein [Actinomycetota bacterium]